MVMTPTEIKDLKALAERASDRPWRFSPWHVEEGSPAVYQSEMNYIIATTDIDNNAAYIVAACNAVPALLAKIKELQGDLDNTRADVKLLFGTVSALDPNPELKVRCEDILRRIAPSTQENPYER